MEIDYDIGCERKLQSWKKRRFKSGLW